MTTTDILPTFLSLLGQDPTTLYEEISGRSKHEAFTDENASLEHDPIVCQARGGKAPAADPRKDKTFAYRHGDLKIIKPQGRNEFLNKDRAYQLYDLDADPQESKNLARREGDFRDQLALLMLEARMNESQIHLLPEATETAVVIPYDPRLSVGSKDMTLDLVVEVSNQLDEDKNIFTQAGTQSLILRADGVLEWTIQGATKARQPITKVLTAPPLEAGDHRITLSVYGHKSLSPIVELYVDNVLQSSMDDDGLLRGFWATTSDLHFGDAGLKLSQAKLHALHFYQDELNALDAPLPEHIFGTAKNDVLSGSRADEALLGGGQKTRMGYRGEGGDELIAVFSNGNTAALGLNLGLEVGFTFV